MKAAFFKQPGQPLEVREIAKPQIASDEVLIQISHCGICSSDLNMTQGKGAYTAPEDTVLGHEMSGTVVELGANVSSLASGDRVAVIPVAGCESCDYCQRGEFNKCAGFEWREGGYAQYIVSKARYCFRLAEHLPLSDGALVEPMAVALRAARHGALAEGQKVLIMGAGPIGLSCIYWTKHFGCEAVVMASSTRRQALALAMGASQFIVNQDSNFETLLAEMGGMPDVVIECTGVRGMINLAVDLIKPHSTVVIPGWCTQQDTFLPMTAMHKELRLQFTALYNSNDFQTVVDTMAADPEASYRAMISSTISLDELPANFEALRQSGDKVKVLLSPNS